MIDRDDVRGIAVVASLLCFVAAMVILIVSLDLPVGANIRTRINEVFSPGEPGLRVWSAAIAVIGMLLALVCRSKRL
jgi:hypothetical protein